MRDEVLRSGGKMLKHGVHQLMVLAGHRLPAEFMSSVSGVQLAAPCYHLACDGPLPPHLRHLYSCRSSKTFEADLDFLLNWGVPLSLDQLERISCHEESMPTRAFFVSFDDGLREVAELVAPICLRKGVPMTMFLNSAFLDNQELCYRHKVSLLIEQLPLMSPATDQKIRDLFGSIGMMLPGRPLKEWLLGVSWSQRAVLDELANLLDVDFGSFLVTQRPYLTTEQVEVLIKSGFSVGSHSVDHPLYSTLPLEEQIRQTAQCCEVLDQRFGVRTRPFAFPFVSDRVDREFFRQILEQPLASLIF
jgi:peptidoglycan/xylan/chitin deacetylase (PgdA/CDA1 family)